jgi:hypothetical protein
MRKTVQAVLAFFLFSCCYSQGISPNVINSSGGSSRSGYYYFEWNIGELALTGQMNSPGNSIIVTNGFIQPYTLNLSTPKPAGYFGYDEIRIFPNPASIYLEINFFTKQKGRISLSIYDMSGKNVYSGSLISHGVDLVERVPVNHLANSVYMLYINLEADNGYSPKQGAYKIVKTD